jgi:hypothetical protein
MFDGFGAILDFTGGLIRNKHERRESKRNREFQEQMSNTAYQRSMADMRKAGLNPILAAKVGGASTPSGSKANFGNPFEGAAQKIQTSKLTKALIDKAEAEADSATAKALMDEQDADFYKENGARAGYTNPVTALTGRLANAADSVGDVYGAIQKRNAMNHTNTRSVQLNLKRLQEQAYKVPLSKLTASERAEINKAKTLEESLMIRVAIGRMKGIIQ